MSISYLFRGRNKGLIGLIALEFLKEEKLMRRSTKKAGVLSLVIAIGTGIAALAGWTLDNTDKSEDNVEEKNSEEKSEEKADEEETLTPGDETDPEDK